MLTFCSSVDIYSSHEGQLYCKPHFRELFKPKAVVDEDVELRKLIFMFCWPCISTHLRNENQLDALFILSLFHHSTSTCFGCICGPSSGGILYIYSNLYMLCFSVARQSTKKHNMYQQLYMYSISPDDELQICPKHVGVE